MKHQLILVEGIPGSGKTTTANQIKKKLEALEIPVILYEEGMSHPADMAWQAYLTKEEYKQFISDCLNLWETSDKTISQKELVNLIHEQARHEMDHVILAYTKIVFPEGCYFHLFDDLAAKEIGDGRRSLQEFTAIHLKRWENFAKMACLENTVYIFECAFLQNAIFELLGVYELSDEAIFTYLSQLLATVKSLNPYLVYLEPSDVERIISSAAKERISDHPSRKDWIDEMANWVSQTNYGKHHHLNQKDGVITFCEERLRIDLKMVNQLNLPMTLIKRD